MSPRDLVGEQRLEEHKAKSLRAPGFFSMASHNGWQWRAFGNAAMELFMQSQIEETGRPQFVRTARQHAPPVAAARTVPARWPLQRTAERPVLPELRALRSDRATAAPSES